MIRKIAFLILAAIGSSAMAQDDTQNSYLGKAPPELSAEKDHWINAKDGLTLEKLKGRVVWLEFSFLG